MSMNEIKYLEKIPPLEILAKQVVEGFITGMHKSPFHGFSVEFAEHRLYNKGESIKDIDWKLFAKTEKLFVKRYEEETNLRCQIIIDDSASMSFPESENKRLENLNKIGFSALAAASLLEILKRQRDAFGLSIYSDELDYYAPAKGSERQKRMLMDQLEKLMQKPSSKTTNTYQILHEIAEKIHRRSLIFLFTDMLQSDRKEGELISALRHLKYNKHEVVLFHVYSGKYEFELNFDERPKKFVDVETGEKINVFAQNYREDYKRMMEQFFNQLKMKCMQYKIDYIPVDIHEGFEKVLSAYLLKRKQIL
ncbi:DUF58 domain-containing protein [Namhaeicola litoreus]|uniref:DUF58 domain-containing protein n=1 Tax=Namhaeicola litoreus TaxID=1052145 RepID=A0ABW3XYX4_9FLAO